MEAVDFRRRSAYCTSVDMGMIKRARSGKVEQVITRDEIVRAREASAQPDEAPARMTPEAHRVEAARRVREAIKKAKSG